MRSTVAAFVLALLLAPRAATAEWHITPMIGVTFSGNTTLLDLENATKNKHVNFGGAVTLLGGGIFGVEGIATFTPHFFRAGDANLLKRSNVVSLMGNVVLAAPRRLTEYSLRPFVSTGIGLMRANAVDALELFPVRSNMLGFNIGGGAIGFLSRSTGVRFDVRYHTSLHRPGQDAPSIGRVHLRYMTASIGLVIRR